MFRLLDDYDNFTIWGWAVLFLTLGCMCCGAVAITTKVIEYLDGNKKTDCKSSKLTVCTGDPTKFGVPSCFDFPLERYSYQQYGDRIVVINKENSSDVVNYPNSMLVSASKTNCEDN